MEKEEAGTRRSQSQKNLVHSRKVKAPDEGELWTERRPTRSCCGSTGGLVIGAPPRTCHTGTACESCPTPRARDRPRRSSLCWGQSVLPSLARMICTLDRHPRQLETSAPAADAVVFVSILSVSCARCVPLHAECSLIDISDQSGT